MTPIELPESWRWEVLDLIAGSRGLELPRVIEVFRLRFNQENRGLARAQTDTVGLRMVLMRVSDGSCVAMSYQAIYSDVVRCLDTGARWARGGAP